MRTLLALAILSVLASPGLACEMHESHAVMASKAVKPVPPPPPVTEAKAEAPQSRAVKPAEPVIKAETVSLTD
ncbi:MAG: hypothetical protein ACJ8AS_09415 [Hyphomicrobiales bacterium]